MKTISFNTGRLYTANGQRITATLHDDGVVTFFDHSRGVYGEFTLPEYVPFTKDIVMFNYIRNRHRNTRRAYQDGLTIGGCNREYKP